jgi:hypothetical protein
MHTDSVTITGDERPTAPFASQGLDRHELSIHLEELPRKFGRHQLPEYRDWRDLFAGDRRAAITQHPDYVIREAVETYETLQRPAHLMTCRNDHQLVAALGLIPKQLHLHIAGRRGPATSLNGFRLAGNDLIGDRCAKVLWKMLNATAEHARQSDADFLLVEDVDDDSLLCAVLRRVARAKFQFFAPKGFQDRLRIRFPDNGDDYWSRFSSRSRRRSRTQVRRLGETRLERVTDVAQVPEFLAHAHQISRQTWQTHRLGLRIQNNASERALFSLMAEQGALRSYLLFREATPIAFAVGTQFNGQFQFEEIGYDRSIAKLSPGFVMLLKIMEDLLQHDPPEMFDFGGGDADYKRRFANDISRSGNIWLVSPGLRRRAVIGCLKARQKLESATRSILADSRLLTALRQGARRGNLHKRG